jgi:hypothetical protein
MAFHITRMMMDMAVRMVSTMFQSIGIWDPSGGGCGEGDLGVSLLGLGGGGDQVDG